MARVNTYLNFAGETEEAFNFYKSIFKGEFEGEITRFSSIPEQEGQARIKREEQNLIMHICLPILGVHRLMGTDAPESIGFKVQKGNNISISLEPDTREETERIFNDLAEGGEIEMSIQPMFWGDYFGSCVDKYGVRWMLSYPDKNIRVEEK